MPSCRIEAERGEEMRTMLLIDWTVAQRFSQQQQGWYPSRHGVLFYANGALHAGRAVHTST